MFQVKRKRSRQIDPAHKRALALFVSAALAVSSLSAAAVALGEKQQEVIERWSWSDSSNLIQNTETQEWELHVEASPEDPLTADELRSMLPDSIDAMVVPVVVSGDSVVSESQVVSESEPEEVETEPEGDNQSDPNAENTATPEPEEETEPQEDPPEPESVVTPKEAPVEDSVPVEVQIPSPDPNTLAAQVQLPTRLMVTTVGEETTPIALDWNLSSYPAEGAYEGEYILTAGLQEDYMWGENVALPSVKVVFASASNSISPLSDVETETSQFRVGTQYYDTWDEAYSAAVSSGETVYLLRNISPFYASMESGSVTVDMNDFSVTAYEGYPAFWVSGDAQLTLSGTGIVNGGNYEFGIVTIVGNGSFTLNDNVTLQGNTSTSNGGGVYNAGTFTMNGGVIQDTSTSLNGGGVYNSGTFTMNGGVIRDTESTRNYSFSNVYGGGGVYNTGTFTMNGGTIQNSSANAHGGGVLNSGTFTMINGTISENSSIYYGGGIYNTGTFEMSGGSITENRAISGQTYRDGGGVLNTGTFTMSGGTITGNRGNGGIYSVSNGSSLAVSGGAVYGNHINDEDIDAIDIVYGNNNSQAGQVSVIAASAMEAEGYTFGDWIFYSNSLEVDPVYTDGSLPCAEHTSDYRYYYQAEIVSAPEVEEGEEPEGIYLDGTNGNDENNGTSSANAVATFERAKSLAESQIGEGAESVTIYVSGTITVTGTDTVEWSLPENVILKRANGFDGYLIQVGDDSVGSNPVLTLSNITIDGNRQSYIYTESLIYVRAGTLNIEEGTVLQNNLAGEEFGISYSGGAVYLNGVTGRHPVINMRGGTITNCASSYLGGGITVANGNFNMSGGSITSNQSLYGGGVSIIQGAKMYFTGGSISGNTADQGGGIHVGGPNTATASGYQDKQYLYMTAADDGSTTGTIDGNTATSSGGGIWIQMNSEADISAGSITNNSAIGSGDTTPWRGGGIYVNGNKDGLEDGKLLLTNVEIAENKSANNGGGLAGCNTSNVYIYLTNGGIFHDNESYYLDSDATGVSSEIYVYNDDNGDGEEEIYISDFMLGGGMYEWYGLNNERVYSSTLDRTDHIYLNNVVAEEDIQAAKKDVTVFITGNACNRDYGGGIATNGTVIIGTDTTEEDLTSKITVTKEWNSGEYTAEEEQADRPESIQVDIQYGDYTLRGIELTAENNWTVTLENMPNDILEQQSAEGQSVAVEVLEVSADQYTLDEESVTAKLDGDELKIDFTNVYTPTEEPVSEEGTLTISKQVRGESTNRSFTFRITLTDENGASLSGSYPFTGSYSGTVSNGSTLTLADGESITVSSLPAGAQYRVDEVSSGDYYVFVYGEGDPIPNTGSIAAGDSDSVRFVNVAPSDPDQPPYTPPERPDEEPSSEPPEESSEPSSEESSEPSVLPSEPSGPSGPSAPTSEPTSEPVSEPAEPTLPQTGQLWWPVAALLGAGAVLVAVGALKPPRGSKRHER